MNKEFVDKVLEAAIENAKTYIQLLNKEFPGSAYNPRFLSDVEFVQWFEQMAMQSPMWPKMLSLVPGGQDDLRRYAKVKGLGRYAPDTPYLDMLGVQ